MKGKILLYGWLLSWVLMVAGLGTMEWAQETGDPVFLLGLSMFMVFVLFSLLIIKNPKEAEEEVERFDLWCEKVCEKINRWLDCLV